MKLIKKPLLYRIAISVFATVILFSSYGTDLSLKPEASSDTLYQVVIIGQSQAGGYAIWNDAITTDTEPRIYTLTNGPLDSDNGPTSGLVLLTEGDVNDNGGTDPNTETSISGLLRQAKASSNCQNCHFLGSIAYRNGIPINGLVKGGYGYEYGWGQLHGDFIRGFQIAQDSGWFWQPIFVLQHGGGGGSPYGVLVNKMKDDFRTLVDSLSSGTPGYFASVQQREKSPVDFGIEMLLALDTVSNADVIISRDNAVEKTEDEIHMTNWGQRHEGVYYGHHIGRKFIAGEDLDPGLRIGNYHWDGSKLIVPILHAIGPLVGTGDHDIQVYNLTDGVTIDGSWNIAGSILEFTPNVTPTGTKDIRLMADRGTGNLRDSRPNPRVTLTNSDGNPYVLYQYLLRFDYDQTIAFRDPLGGTQTLNSFNHSVNNGGSTDYYVYHPLDYDSDPLNRPILIALHGLGEFDGNPSILLSSPFGKGIAELANDGMDFPLMVFSPHGRRRIGGQYSDYWNIELLKQFVEHITSNYSIDPSRIYFTGFSTGAQAVWQYAVEYPEDVAAIIPLAGRTNLTDTEFGLNLRNTQYSCSISTIPINAFHGSADSVIPPVESIGMVNAVNNCLPEPSPLAKINLINGLEHDPLRPLVYSDISSADNIYSWMLQFVKGQEAIDEVAPRFVSNTPVVDEVYDTGFDLTVLLDEIGTTYFAAYANGFVPSVSNVKNGTGTDLLFNGSITNTQSGSTSITNLNPQTNYDIWFVAEDDANPANTQTSLTQRSVRTSYVIDTDPPQPPQSISLTPDVTSISVNWTISPSADVELHEVYRIDSVWQTIDTTLLENPMNQVSKKHNLQFENNVNDISGNGVNSNSLNGVVFSSSNVLEGEFAAQFDGNNDFIDLDVGNQYIHSTFSQRTVSMWIYPNSTNGIRDLFDEGGSTNGIALRISNGEIQGAVQNQQVIRTVSTPLNANEWSHVALQFDNGQFRLFLNGIERSSLIAPFPTVNSHGNGGGLGGTNSSNAFDSKNANFHGAIDDFVITDNAVDPVTLQRYFEFYRPLVDSTLTTNTTLLASLEVPTSQYTDMQVNDSVYYTYFVVAKDTAGNSSAASALQSAKLLDEVLVPEKPQNLTINLVQADHAFLQWEEVNTSGIRNYAVFRSENSFSSVEDADLIADEILANTFLDSTVQSSTTYHYTVVAYNVLNEASELADLVSISTVDFEPPLAPFRFEGQLSGIFVQLEWSDSLASDVSSYRLYRGNGSPPEIESTSLFQEFAASTLAFEDQTVEESQEYYYVLTALDSAGNESEGSDPVSLLIPNLTPPSSPKNLTAIFSTQSVDLSWDKNIESDLGGYTLWKSAEEGTWPDDFTLIGDSIQDSFYHDMEVVSLSTYHYALTAYDSAGNTSTVSEIIQVTTPDIQSPEPPQNLTLTSGIGSIDLVWNQSSSSDVTHYLVYKKQGSEPSLTVEDLIDSTGFDQLAYRDTNVAEGYSYYYIVAALDSSSNLSEGSNTESAQAQNVIPPSTPSGIQLSISDDTSISIEWDSNTEIDFAGYKIYKGLQPDFTLDATSLLEDNLSEPSYEESRLEYGTTYYYSIQAFDLAGNTSEPSSIQSITTNPRPPLGPSIVSTVKINWNPSGVSSGLAEWNDLLLSVPFGYTTYNNLYDSVGNNVGYQIVIPNAREQSNINNTQDNGPSFTGGVYPDEVMRYAGWTSSAGRIFLRNLNPENTYSIELYSGRNYNSTGNTTFTVQGNSIDVQCYNNKTELVSFQGLVPDSNNEIEIVFRENNTWSKGYLNGMIIREYEAGIDAVPPTPPQNLVSSFLSEDHVQLAWNHVTTAGMKDYSVYRSSSVFSKVEDAELLASEIQTNSFIDSTLESSSTYFYAVVAYNILNEVSEISDLVSISTSDFEAPFPPADLIANLIETNIHLNWSMSSSSDVQTYRIYRSENSAPEVATEFLYQSVVSTTNEFLDTNVEESKEYFYFVTAVDSSGNESLPTLPVNLLIPDATPPQNPENLIASLRSDAVILLWNPNEEPDLAGYSVWRSTVGSNWPDDFSVLAADISESQYNDTSIASETEYYYTITAQDLDGNSSEASNSVFVSTPDTEAPESPTSISGEIIGNTAHVQWSISPSQDVANYNLYRTEETPDPSSESPYLSLEANETAFLDTSVEESKEYFYFVTAVDSSGNESLPTSHVTLLIPDVTAPATPINLTAVLGTEGVLLSWDSNTEGDLAGYTIYKSDVGSSWPADFTLLAENVQNTAFNDTDVESSSQYFYAISAADLTGNTSSISAIVSIATPDIDAPEPPQNLTLASQIGAIDLSWELSSSGDVDRYRIYRSIGEAPNLSSQNLLDSTALDVNSYSDPNVSEGMVYHYVVTAVDASHNESTPSNSAADQPKNVTPPAAPENVTIALNAQNQVELSWDQSPEADLSGYTVWRSLADFNATSQAEAVTSNSPSNAYLDVDVENETTYFYRIQAVDVANNTSTLSNLVSVQTDDLLPPATPTNPTVVSSGNSLVLGWLANEDEDIAKYAVYGGITTSDPATIQASLILEVDTAAFPMHSYDLSTNDEGITYYFAVTAIDDAGNESSLSSIVGGALPNITPPAPPSRLQLSLADYTSVSLDWDDNTEHDFAYYQVHRGSSSLLSFDETSLIADSLTQSYFVESGLDYASTYFFGIIAFDSGGNSSAPGAVQSIQTNSEPPSGPTLVSTVKVNWTKSGTSSGLAEWNDLTMNLVKGYTTYQVSDTIGNDVDYDVVVAHAQGNSNINGTTDNGTGFTNGIYPNAVMRYAGWTSSAGRIYLRGLNQSNTYNIELFSGRNYNSSGNTTFTVNGESIDIQCYLNKNDLAVFTDVIPDSNGEIEIIFQENNTWSKGYLNGMVIREYMPTGSASRTIAQTHSESFAEISEMSSSSEFTIYPIPTKDGKITLKGLFPEEKEVTMRIVDVTGKILFKKVAASTVEESIILTAEPGTYFFHLYGQQTNITRRIIISE